MERTTQIDLWTYPDASTLGLDVARGVDLTGFSVEATDGGIGKIDEATYDTSRSYIVVDTGPWIFGKKVMLPAGVIKQGRPRHRDCLRQPVEGRDQERARVRREPLSRRCL